MSNKDARLINIGKQIKLLRKKKNLSQLKLSIMLGISRKSLLDMANEDNFTKDIYTLAMNAIAVAHNVDYIRVHNVKLHKQLLKLLENFEK